MFKVLLYRITINYWKDIKKLQKKLTWIYYIKSSIFCCTWQYVGIIYINLHKIRKVSSIAIIQILGTCASTLPKILLGNICNNTLWNGIFAQLFVKIIVFTILIHDGVQYCGRSSNKAHSKLSFLDNIVFSIMAI